VIRLSARTEVDKEQGLVTLEDIKVPKVSFPAATPKQQQEYLRGARQHAPAGVRTVSLAQLEANLAITQASDKAKGMPVKNDPPRIIMSPRRPSWCGSTASRRSGSRRARRSCGSSEPVRRSAGRTPVRSP